MNTTTAARPKTEQGSHWYTATGEPMHTVTGKNGKPKKTTLREARELKLLPSVTSVLKDMKAAPSLVAWKIEMAVLATQTTPRKENEPLDKFIQRAMDEAEAERETVMDLGTRIHAGIESYFAEGEPAHDVKVYIDPVSSWWCKTEETIVAVEQSVVGDGYAGRVDLVSSDGKLTWVTDFKSCKTKPDQPDDKVGRYDEHHLQLAAYAAALEPKHGPVAVRNVYISTTEPGRVVVATYPDWREMARCFQHFLEAWCILKGYDPRQKESTVAESLAKAGL